ncbi:MAG: hypothetical protein F6J89_02080 [Symploca sp. SIO1C4]|uniref:Uncharacterized protein n=1 Tax=Symploca sp. SIO1C4 TaxID=2607765 RepID=A0A6B3MZZ5_9CYAN|nr:hypothetical protein [Symploca sp. SIO1C4]
MAKKASILGKNYNPIASRLKDFNNLPQPNGTEQEEVEVSIKTTSSFHNTPPKIKAEIISPEEDALLNKESTIKIDENIKLLNQESKKRCEIKFMCSPSERDRWHEYSYKITGKRNSLSNVIRSLLLILEHSEAQLERVSETIREVQTPPRGDSLKTILYEKKIASVIWEAVRRASKIQ